MADQRLLAFITVALLMSPGSGANAAFSLAQLQRLETLIVDGDCGGLWLYLRNDPSLTLGDDPLAAELRNFTNGINGGLIDCLSVPGRAGEPQQGQQIAPIY